MNISRSFWLLKRGTVLLKPVRCMSLSTANRTVPAADNPQELKGVITKAESIVGYPTSFLSLRWLLNDEAANIVLHLRKLIGTQHPLLKTAKNLLVGSESSSWGLIVLLVSKAAGVNSVFKDIEHDHVAGILHSQRVLAEVTEMIRTSNLLHKGLINIDKKMERASDMNFGNSVALLSGDYLLSTSFHELALLKNHDLNEVISSSLRDLVEADFIGPRTAQNVPLPARPSGSVEDVVIPNIFDTSPFEIKNALGNAKAEWTLRNILGGASLLAKGCQCALMLSDHPKEMQEVAYIFGRNLALAWQANHEIEQFQSEDLNEFSFISAPVLFHLQHVPEFYSEFEALTDTDLPMDYDKIRSAVMDGPGLIETQKLKVEFVNLALSALSNFKESKAKDALVNLVNSL